MSAHAIALISATIVALSGVPYLVRVYQVKIKPVPTTWLLWSIIGLALCLAYKSSGAKDNLFPAIVGFVSPTLVLVVSAWKGKWAKMELHEAICLVMGPLALEAWWFVRNDPELAVWSLCLAIASDMCAAIPTFIFFWRHPEEDRPFAWFFFSVGYFVVIFAVPEKTFANYVLPVYMSIGAMTAALLLIVPRVKRGVPLREWI